MITGGAWTRLLALLLLGMGVHTAAAADIAPTAAERPGDAERQILVMIRMAPAHVRPNSGYGGRYGDIAGQAARDRIARGIAREHQLELVDGWPMPLLGVDCFVMRLRPGQSVDQAVQAVSRHRAVAWSQPMAVYEVQAREPPNDPLKLAQPAWSRWRLGDLHDVATGRGVIVAVVDSKIEVGHPDLAGQFVANKDFVTGKRAPSEFHGTGVAGVIAAKAGNGAGIVGVAPNARLMALRACSQASGAPRTGPATCSSLNVAKALHFAIDRGAHVINLSFSGPKDRLFAELIGIALRRGVSVVASFDRRKPNGGFPASYPGVIAVADEALRSLPQHVYAAPGRDVPTTRPGGKWHLVNGSSYAAAHVSGLVALVRQSRGNRSRLVLSRHPGSRTIDACATLVGTSRDCDCSCEIVRHARMERD